jgi:hypothetical protein
MRLIPTDNRLSDDHSPRPRASAVDQPVVPWARSARLGRLMTMEAENSRLIAGECLSWPPPSGAEPPWQNWSPPDYATLLKTRPVTRHTAVERGRTGQALRANADVCERRVPERTALYRPARET